MMLIPKISVKLKFLKHQNYILSSVLLKINSCETIYVAHVCDYVNPSNRINREQFVNNLSFK